MRFNLTHLDKLYWVKEKITKGELIAYYEAIFPFILPYLKNRPLVLKRFPEGVDGLHFIQKNVENAPSFLKTTPIEHSKKIVNYSVIQNIKSLLYVVNLGSIELHTFNARIKNLEKPDYLILDLDPEDISFNSVIEVANVIHEILDKMKIPHFCKTSGATGLHIYIPTQGKYDYSQIKDLARLFAHVINQALPEITSLERSPKNRQKKVYIDWGQNEHAQTVICPYSVRAVPGANVSTPLLWKEVKQGLHPSDFTLKNIPKRLSQKGDIFKDVLGKGVNLKGVLKSLEKLI